jgi:hypothetical protein
VAVDGLMQALDDPDGRVTASARQALDHLGVDPDRARALAQ